MNEVKEIKEAKEVKENIWTRILPICAPLGSNP
jgi:hypothetical protein